MSFVYAAPAEEKSKFLDHVLVNQYGTADLAEIKRKYPQSKHPEDYALFCGLDAAFIKNGAERWGKTTPVAARLICYLAAYGRDVVSGHDLDHHSYLHMRDNILDYFLLTLHEAIKGQRIKYMDGKAMHGCFPLPDWLIEKYHPAYIQQRTGLAS